ncbi:MAG: pyocin knob domain-containing protein [Candidatus Copromonas sp.]|nr:pyocin knob domain-containing protein [Candidatus Copromonas sp.]
MSETKTKNLCTVPAADLNDSQYFIAEDGGELKRIPKAQVVLKKLEKMLATDTENLAGGGEVTAQELLDALAEQVANKLLAKSQVVNNLLATVEGNPLDATQGKALKELIDTTNNNLSNAGIPTVKNITDLYAIKKSGFYCYDAGASNAPMSSRGGMVIANYLSDAWISLNVVPYALSKIYTNSKYNSTWTGWSELASKDDLPNIFTTTLGTSNQESNHATTIKRLWNSFPERQVFACNLVDSNNFCVFGFTYGNHKYGAVLYLAFNSCGIVKCINGNFSDTEL